MSDTMILFTKKLIKRYMAHNIAASSAQIAYYWIMAFFPFLIFIISLLTYTKIPAGILIDFLAKAVPASLVPFIQNTINQFINYRSTALLSAGVLVTLWSGGTAVNALTKGIHLAYNSKQIKPFWLTRMMAVLYTILLAVLIIVLMISLVFGNKIGDYLMGSLPMNQGIFMPIWNLARLIMPFLALIITLYIIYRVIPRKHLKCKNVWPGTLFVSLGWYVFSLIFSIYVDNYSKYNQLYGSIGGVFVLLIWLYASCMLLLIGAEINALYQELKINPVRLRRERIKLT